MTGEIMSLCACLGPQGDDPMCPCQMRAAGRTPTPIWTDAKRAELKAAVTDMIEAEDRAMDTHPPSPAKSPSECIASCGNGEPCDQSRCPLPSPPEGQ